MALFLVFVRKKNGEAQIVLLDHGLYQQLSKQEMEALAHMWTAIVLNNPKKMEQYAAELGVKGTYFVN